MSAVSTPQSAFATYPSLRERRRSSAAAHGLGAEFVTQLAAQGVRVGFVDIQEDRGRALTALADEGSPALYQHCDVRDVAALQDGDRRDRRAARPGHGAGQQRGERPAAVRRDAERGGVGRARSRSTCATTSSPPRRSRR